MHHMVRGPGTVAVTGLVSSRWAWESLCYLSVSSKTANTISHHSMPKILHDGISSASCRPNAASINTANQTKTFGTLLYVYIRCGWPRDKKLARKKRRVWSRDQIRSDPPWASSVSEGTSRSLHASSFSLIRCSSWDFLLYVLSLRSLSFSTFSPNSLVASYAGQLKGIICSFLDDLVIIFGSLVLVDRWWSGIDGLAPTSCGENVFRCSARLLRMWLINSH